MKNTLKRNCNNIFKHILNLQLQWKHHRHHPFLLVYFVILTPKQHRFKTRSGPAGRLKAGTRPDFKKIREVKNLDDLADSIGWFGDLVDLARPGQKLGCNSLIIYFLKLKWYCFDLLKKLGLIRWPDQNLDPSLETSQPPGRV